MCVWREENVYIIRWGTWKQSLLLSDLQGLNDPGLKVLEIIILYMMEVPKGHRSGLD